MIMSDMFSLEGRRFLITGGTRGIGRAMAIGFAAAGAAVIANYVRDVRSAKALQSEADKAGYAIELCRADLTSTKGLERLRLVLDASDAGLDGLIHCAATGVHNTLEELTIRHFDWTFALNVRAFFELVTLVSPRLNTGASIIAMSSAGAARAVYSYSVIGSSKGALESLARHMAREFAPRGIRVNIIRAGSVLTDAWASMPDGEKRIEEAIRRSPVGRLVTADEVARAAQFLCSDAAAGIVGHTLVVDGGEGIVE